MSGQAAIIAIVASYAALATLHLAVITKLGWSRPSKLLAAALMSALYVVTFHAAEGLRGWSAPVAVPERFKVLATRVVEPNARRNDPGAIHVWLEELDASNIPSGTPRAYVLPYSVELAQNASSAQEEINQGHQVAARSRTFGEVSLIGVRRRKQPRIDPKVESSGGDASGGLLDPSKLGGQSKSLDFMPLPRPVLPAKDDPM